MTEVMEKKEKALMFLTLATIQFDLLDNGKLINEYIKDCFNKTYNCIKYNDLISAESISEFNEKTESQMNKLCEFLLQELEKNLEGDIAKKTLEYITPLLTKNRVVSTLEEDLEEDAFINRTLPHLKKDRCINLNIEKYFKYHRFTPTEMFIQTIVDAFYAESKMKKTEDYKLHSWNQKTITALVAYIACEINDLKEEGCFSQQNLSDIINILWEKSGFNYYKKIDNFIIYTLPKKIKHTLLIQIGIELYEKFGDNV